MNTSKHDLELLEKLSKTRDSFFNEISKKFVVDYRKPNVVRVAPVPLYNSFYEVYLFVKEIDRLVKSSG